MKDLLLLVAGAVIMWMWLQSGGHLPTSLVPPQLMQMAMPQPGSATVLDAPQAAPQAPPPVIRAYTPPAVPPTPDQALGKAGGYFVINGYRLYCDLITPDLQYTGDEIMQEWWNSLSDDMKRIQKGAC